MALELRDMNLADTLKFLAQKGNLNIIASKGVEGKASLFLKDVSIKDALDIIVLANNLGYEMRGDILYVMTEDEYKLMHGANFKDSRKVVTYILKYAKPEAAFKTLELIKSEVGKVIVDEDSGTVVLMDTPERLEVMQKTLVSFDQPALTKVFPLQYAKAKDVVAILAARLDAKKTGTITAFEKNNEVIVTALPERMKEAEELIKGMDVKTKQVFLEARILKVVLSDDYHMGIDWEKVWREIKMYGLNIGGAFALPSTVTNYAKVGVGNDVTTGHDFSVIIKALQEFGETRNLSSPSITVIDGQEAKIHVGRTEAYVTTTVATGGTTSTTAASVSFLDVGVRLSVTPTINDKGYVTLKVNPEISNVDSTLTYQIAPDVTNTVPLVARTTAETTVMVKDGTTAMIGGLRKDEKIKTVSKLPILGDIPGLGGAFRKTSENLEKTEIVVFLTPHIVSGDTDAQESKLKPKQMRQYQ